MRILHILDEPWDSGLSNYALTLSAGLKARGHELHVWALSGKPAFEAALDIGVDAFPVEKPWLRYRTLRNYIDSRGIEIVNAHTGPGHTLALFLGAPFLVRTRGDARKIKAHLGSRWTYGRTQGFIASNNIILKQFSDAYAGLGVHSKTIYQGLEDPWPSGPPGVPAGPCPEGRGRSQSSRHLGRQWRCSDPWSAGGAFRGARGPQIGIVARLDPVKGHDDFLLAAQRIRQEIPSARFLIAGPEANLRTGDIEKKAHALGVGEAVIFAGRVPGVFEMMALCSVGVVASRGSEAVSRTALEWMATGRPLVATSAGCLGELVEEGKTGFVVPPSAPNVMADRILRILNNRDTARSMGKNARESFLRRFSLDRFARETEEFYFRIRSPSPARTDSLKAAAAGEQNHD